MSVMTARAYQSNFTGRIASVGSSKSPGIKPFHGIGVHLPEKLTVSKIESC